jgi:STE24 endopeptidase
MTPATILYIILAIVSLNFILGLWLDHLNNRSWSPVLPPTLSSFYDPERYKLSQQYHKDKERVSLWAEIISFTAIIIMLLFGLFGWLGDQLAPYIQNPIWRTLVYFAILAFASAIIGLPFEVYNTFVIETRYGFNKTTPGLYILDKLKGIGLAIVLGGSLGYFILWLITVLGQNFWIYAWITISIIMLLLNMFYTSLIVPLFNKLTPLQAGSLRDKIEAYARSVNFPLTNIYVIDGSKRSTKANAFFSGIGKSKKIVLYDTLIEKHTEEELVSILAHEVGHYKRKHIQKGLFISLLTTGFMLWLLSRFIFSEKLSLALGGSRPEIYLNLLAFSILFEPISLMIGLAGNALSRSNEYEADEYAVTTYDKKPFGEALIRLSVDHLSNLQPHPAYVFFHYSHPTLLQRLKGIHYDTDSR